MSANSTINITRTQFLYISKSLVKVGFVIVFERGAYSELPKRRLLTPFPRDWSPHLDSREPGRQIPLLLYIWRFIAIVTKARVWSPSWDAQSLSTPLHAEIHFNEAVTLWDIARCLVIDWSTLEDGNAMFPRNVGIQQYIYAS
jgi:hypothetical protein